MSADKKSTEEGLSWWQLSLIGIGCTIGTGYFLGSSIGIKVTGPSIVFSFLLAAAGTYIVYDLLARMTAADPNAGSFCYYARKAFGRWAGFSCGWNYWSSNILIMGSQLIGLSLLTKFWFPHVPLWIFAAVYSILALGVVLLGTKGFDRAENVFAVIKTAAIVMFLILAILAVMNVFGLHSSEKPNFPEKIDTWFSKGLKGIWASLIYAFYAFGGIEVIGLMAMQLKNKKDAAKAGSIMMIVLTALYVLSIGFAVTMAPLDAFSEKESPFVTALESYHLHFFPHVFNGAIIIAGFSTMTASLFGVTNLLVTLAQDGDAPGLFQKKLKAKKLPLSSLALAACGLIASIITALLLPGKIYEYITTAASLLLLLNWAFILLSYFKRGKKGFLSRTASSVGLLILTAAVSGTLLEKEIRPGFFISMIFVVCIGLAAVFMKFKVWNKDKAMAAKARKSQLD